MFIQDIFPQNYFIKRIDTPTKRVYNCNNEYEFPSITTVLSVMSGDWVKEWRERVGDEFADKVSRKATSIGTGVHELCEDYLQNKPINKKLFKVIPEVRTRFNNFKQFLDTIEKVHLLERPVYSTILGIAGTVDCVATINGEIYVVDFKTSNRIKEKEQIHDYFAQATFYAYACMELYSLRRVPRICIAIAVDGIKEPQVFFENPRNWVGYLKEALEKYKGNK